jgi:hypothetical protein
MRTSVAIGTLALMCLVTAEANAQSHPIIGTWEMSAERSTFRADRELRTEVRRFEQRDNGYILFTLVFVDVDGNPGFTQAAFKLDGQAYPIYTQDGLSQFLMEGSESGGREWIAVDANTLENRVAGNQPGLVFTHSVAPDGRTMTGEMLIPGEQGLVVAESLVFERVD